MALVSADLEHPKCHLAKLIELEQGEKCVLPKDEEGLPLTEKERLLLLFVCFPPDFFPPLPLHSSLNLSKMKQQKDPRGSP